MRIGALLGLGIAYAGSNRTIVIDSLKTVFNSDKKTAPNSEILGIAGLSLGLIGVGSCNAEITEILLHTILGRSESELKDTYTKFLILGLALLYLGRQEAAEAVMVTLEVLGEPMNSMASTMVEICAYAGTGNVLKIQKLLHICSEHYETSGDDDDEDDFEDCRSSSAPDVS